MPAPTQIAGSPFQTAWTTGATKTTVVGAVGVGDLIVVETMVENFNATTFVWPTNPANSAASPATITWTARGTVATLSQCASKSWTGIVTVAGNLTVSITATGGSSATYNWGYTTGVYAAANHGGVGLTPAGATATGSAPTLTAAWSANSAIWCINGDWSALDHGSPRSYRTGAGAATEVNYAANIGPGAYSTEAWYHANTGAGGSQAVGLTTPTMAWSLVAIEVLAAASTGVSGSSVASGPGVAGEFNPYMNYRMWL